MVQRGPLACTRSLAGEWERCGIQFWVGDSKTLTLGCLSASRLSIEAKCSYNLTTKHPEQKKGINQSANTAIQLRIFKVKSFTIAQSAWLGHPHLVPLHNSLYPF